VENIDGMPDGSFQGNKSVYSTSIIGNVSLAWIRKVATSSSAPFMAYIAPKAAHDPFEPATWYATASTTVCTQRVTAWVSNSVFYLAPENGVPTSVIANSNAVV
jgi:hypothetical protein